MPARTLCQKFFRGALSPFHQYRQNALLDATVALTRGASLTLTSIGRYLPGSAQVKNKIKRVDRLLGNTSLHEDIPLIFRNITSLLTRQFSWCVIAVDWSGYPSQEYHILRASLICDGRSIPLHKRETRGRKNQRSRGRLSSPTTEKEKQASAKEPWLIFTSTEEFKPREIMKLYSRRMQIEQNFRDEKSERIGFGLRASYSRSAGRLSVLSLLATLSTIVLWLIGYHAENTGLH
ncbi:transposase, partial [Salmonella enterica]|nr:transposase [Salmonella enterica]